MRRLWLILLLTCISLGAQAQWSISANLSYGNQGHKNFQGGLSSFDGSLPTGQEMTFTPQLGFSFNGAVEIGVDLGVGNSIYTYTDGYYDPIESAYTQSSEVTQTMLTYNAGGYIRVRLAEWDKLSLHLEGAAGYLYGFGLTTTVEKRNNSFYGESSTVTMVKAKTLDQLYAIVIPVFEYEFGRHVSLDAYLNFASLVFESTHTTMYKDYYKTAGLDERYLDSESTTQSFDIGLHSLTTSLISLGFSYTF